MFVYIIVMKTEPINIIKTTRGITFPYICSRE